MCLTVPITLPISLFIYLSFFYQSISLCLYRSMCTLKLRYVCLNLSLTSSYLQIYIHSRTSSLLYFFLSPFPVSFCFSSLYVSFFLSFFNFLRLHKSFGSCDLIVWLLPSERRKLRPERSDICAAYRRKVRRLHILSPQLLSRIHRDI